MTKKEMPKLKPCPFCGGVAVIREDISHSTGVFFGCNTSGCLGADMWEESVSEAISAWNTRADLPPTPAEAMRCPEVEALVDEIRYAVLCLKTIALHNQDERFTDMSRIAWVRLQDLLDALMTQDQNKAVEND